MRFALALAVVLVAIVAAVTARPGAGKPVAGAVTIAWGGDTVLGSTYGLPPREGRSLLVHVAPLFRAADIGFVNLEEALSNGSAAKCAAGSTDCFAFGAPMSYASALPASGIKIVNLANNHAADYGTAGEASTLVALKQAHVAWTGKPGQIQILNANGVRVAFLGFAPYPWASRLDRIPQAVALVKRAAAKADVVVVAIHAGAEGSTASHVPQGTEYYLGENRGDSRAFTHAVIDAGADLVVGSGPHVVRGVQWYHDRLIAYSLGNLAGWHTFGLGGALSESAVLSITLSRDGRIERGSWTSLELEDSGIPELDSTHASLALVNRLSKSDFGSTAARFAANGNLVVRR
jgi:poly-gamma-glutamate capsule biosynthesis protein CapA/YwtB (metallophosphatase superfamily)